MGSQWNAGSDKKGTSVKIIAVEGIVHISEFSYLYVISAFAVNRVATIPDNYYRPSFGFRFVGGEGIFLLSNYNIRTWD